MSDVTTLMTLLQPHLAWHRARLFCFAALVLALIRVRTVSLAGLALVLNPQRPEATNYPRLQRFFALFALDRHAVARLLLALRPSQAPLVLVMDRTEWKFGTKRFNLLVVGYLLEGFVVPLAWIDLDKPGATSEAERIELMAALLKQLDPLQIEALVADREFIGERFFQWLIQRTHVKEPERLEKLVAVLSVALVWAVKVGQWRSR